MPMGIDREETPKRNTLLNSMPLARCMVITTGAPGGIEREVENMGVFPTVDFDESDVLDREQLTTDYGRPWIISEG